MGHCPEYTGWLLRCGQLQHQGELLLLGLWHQGELLLLRWLGCLKLQGDLLLRWGLGLQGDLWLCTEVRCADMC